MNRFFLFLLFFSLHLINAQSFPENDEFLKYGPFTARNFTDLKEALKSEEPVYRLDLKNKIYEPKVWDKFGKMNQLMSLRLFNNQLSEWPEGMQQCRYLCYLSSYLNPLQRFMSYLPVFTSLQYLEIQHSKIDSIPAHVASLSRLKTLKFGNTGDTLKIPGTFRFLHSLKELEFENVILDSNIHRLFKAKNLEKIILSGTGIKKLPRSIGQLQNLDVLILDNNEIFSLPWEIGYLKKLRILRLVNNKIERLPDTLTELENLSILDLRGNPLPAEELEKWKILLPGCEIKF